MKNIIFKGSGVAIVTPFKNNETEVDFEKLGDLIEFQIKNKTDAIIICGTTGESATMSDEEKISAIKYTIEKVNKRIPVIAGTGSNSTSHAIYLSKKAEELGADGLLVVTPYYNKCTQNGLVKHFEAIANSTKLPIIAYSVPSRTGVNITPKTAKELSKINNIVAIKEASGNISQIAQIASICKEDLNIYSGNDDQTVPILSLGGIGVISVFANVAPKESHDIVENFLNGNIQEARDLHLKYLDLMNKLFIEVNPIPVKEALNLLGFNVGKCRMPLSKMDENNVEILKEALKILK